MTFRIRPEGMKQIEDGVSQGLILAGNEVAERGKANIAPFRVTGAVEDTIRVIDVYADDWPDPAVIVTTGSGDGFFVHEGTVDTPAHPFFAQALDSVVFEMGGLLKQGFGSSGAQPFRSLSRRFGSGVARR
jgi:hypothetical protein